MSLRSRSNRLSMAPILMVLVSSMAVIAMHGAGPHGPAAPPPAGVSVGEIAQTHHTPDPRTGPDDPTHGQQSATTTAMACIAVVTPSPTELARPVSPASIQVSLPATGPRSHCHVPEPPVPRTSSIT